MNIAQDQYPGDAKADLQKAANLVFVVALANWHLLRPHLENLADYCAREGADFNSEISRQIRAQFPMPDRRPKCHD